MGGHQAGEVASRLGMDTFIFDKEHCGGSRRQLDIFDSDDQCFTYHTPATAGDFHSDRAIVEQSLENPELVGMGSTLAGMAIHDFTDSLINVVIAEWTSSGTTDGADFEDDTLAEDQVGLGIMTRDEVGDSQSGTYSLL